MDDLDALLADLQSTTSHLTGGSGGGTPDGFNHTHHYSPVYSDKNHVSPIIKQNYKENLSQPASPRSNMKEVTVTSTTTYHHTGHPGLNNSGPSALNSNLSELDSLLEDLNTTKYSAQPERKAQTSPIPVPSPSPQHLKSVSPTGSTGSGGYNDNRPTVESLLDELQSAVAPNSPRSKRQVTTTTTITTKTSANRPISPTAGYTLPTAASSATQELDDLMASLSDFKITSAPTPNQATVTDSLYAKPNKLKQPQQQSAANNTQLDTMLGTLQSDMSRQGISTAQKGCCAACGKPIVGQVVTALAKTWHPEHFTCIHCKQELGTKNFFERDGQPYCETDYHNLFSPRCAYCNGPILDKCVSALDKSWHPEHFFCAQCGNQFGEEGFHEKDGKPYCRDDYFEMFAPKCGGCSRPIMENYISALNTQWHPECFVCRDCKSKLQGSSFYAMEGKPVCAKCVGVDEDDEEGEEEN
ncbi:hypothetical protein CHUAL_005775 [Chamberlinius hualienensis]